MARDARGNAPSGLIVVDKPGGMTSHDVVARIRRLAGTRRVGHAGTLDPMATGVLVVGVEKATRLLGHLTLTEKEYQATIRLGQATDTGDAEGTVLPPGPSARPAAQLTRAQVEAAAAALTGEIQQVPPAVSAIKVAGRRAYQLAREGAPPVLPPRPVTVWSFTVQAVRPAPAVPADGARADGVPADGVPADGARADGVPADGVPADGARADAVSADGVPADSVPADGARADGAPAEGVPDDRAAGPTAGSPTASGPGGLLDVDVEVRCSSGTYVRALARDMGEALGVGGHLTRLRRTRVGPYDLSAAHGLDELAERLAVLPLAEAAAAAFPVRELTAEEARSLSHGGRLPGLGGEAAGPAAAFGPDGTLIALVEEKDGVARPLAVFVP
jgi:tRNA pseudouridine(55) synthase